MTFDQADYMTDNDNNNNNNNLMMTTTTSATSSTAEDAVGNNSDEKENGMAEDSFSAVGPEMTKEDIEAFENYLQDYLTDTLKDKLDISSVTSLNQEYDRPEVQLAFVKEFGLENGDNSYLHIEIRVIGEYIPIDESFDDEWFGNQILDSINIEPSVQTVMQNIQQSSTFFASMTEMYAIDEESVVEAPSSSPSAPPSRSFDQQLKVRLDPGPTGSYGLVFTVRTPKGGNTIVLKGMSFVTLHEGPLEYEMYSKLGPYDKFFGRTAQFDLIASGQTIGKGAKEYTPILLDDTTAIDNITGQTLKYQGFDPVHVPGDGGERSIYVTTTKRFKTDEDGPIPILFSYPKDGNEGEKGYAMITSNEALEIYEGDGVLDVPWPQNGEGPYYRRPRGFIGIFDYDRNPCRPIEGFTGWPCPYVAPEKVTRRPTGKPTTRPTIIDSPMITESPTIVVTENPTYKPTPAPSTKNPVEIKTETPATAATNDISSDGIKEKATNDVGTSGKGRYNIILGTLFIVSIRW